MNLYQEIEKSFPVLEKLFSDFELRFFMETPVFDLCGYHFSLGLWIRNNLLCEESALYKLFLENGAKCRDDMSALIIRIFHYRLNS